jgi:hypothetical protein
MHGKTAEIDGHKVTIHSSGLFFANKKPIQRIKGGSLDELQPSYY